MLNTKMIGHRLAVARKNKNISQAQLAQQLFISAQAVGKWERGESMPDILTLNRLADILEVDLNYFSEGLVAMESPTASPELYNQQSEELPAEKQQKKLGWDMSRSNWVDADFSGLKNVLEKFSASNMQRCKFIGSDLSGLLLKSNHVDSCDFSSSIINNSTVQTSHLVNNIFKDCSLKETEFSRSHITGCDFSGADFSGSVFKSGGFVNNIVENAVWKGSVFIGMQIEDLVVSSMIEDCYFERCVFSWVKFQNSAITNTFFKDNRFKRIRFIDCQADRLSYEFLKIGKADLTGISQLPS